LDTSMEEMGKSVKKCMNFANVLLMLYDFFGTSFSGALNNEKLQKRFDEIIISIIPINNLASRKLAWLMKEFAIWKELARHLGFQNWKLK
uniref:Cytochrome P450 n=1 Tax=Rodentolepis nana TaxID=102285 RepID=A0A0R3T078_RODNA